MHVPASVSTILLRYLGFLEGKLRIWILCFVLCCHQPAINLFQDGSCCRRWSLNQTKYLLTNNLITSDELEIGAFHQNGQNQECSYFWQNTVKTSSFNKNRIFRRDTDVQKTEQRNHLAIIIYLLRPIAYTVFEKTIAKVFICKHVRLITLTCMS